MITNESTNHGNLWLAILASIGVALLASILYIVIYNLGKISVAVSFLVALAASYVYIKIYKKIDIKGIFIVFAVSLIAISLAHFLAANI